MDRHLGMGRTWRWARDGHSPLQVLLPDPCLGPCGAHRCIPKAPPACKPSSGLTQNPPASCRLGSGPGGPGRYSTADGVRLGGRKEKRGLDRARRSRGKRAATRSPPASQRTPSGRLLGRSPLQRGASSHAQQCWPARPSGGHASVPKWAEATGRGGEQPRSPSSSPRPRSAPAASRPEPEAVARGPVQPRLQHPRGALRPPSPARPAAARQVGGAEQREACAGAQVFACVFRGCSAGQRVPCEPESVSGCTSRREGGERRLEAGGGAPGLVANPRRAPRGLVRLRVGVPQPGFQFRRAGA